MKQVVLSHILIAIIFAIFGSLIPQAEAAGNWCFTTEPNNTNHCFQTESECKTRERAARGSNATIHLICFDKSAQTGDPAVNRLENPFKNINTIFDLFDQIMKVVVRIALPIMFVFLILAGFRLVTAQGNSEKLSGAKKTLKYVFIGMVLILSARALAAILASTFLEIIGR